MPPFLPLLIVLLAVIALTGAIARRVSAPLPVLLALAGFALAALPGVPRVPLDPSLILVLFLPPLLYADAFNTSWVDFKRWLRPILMLAIGLVGFTILTVGLVAHALIPGLPWAACFTLGAIVSPTDTVAVQAVLERLRIPRRMTAVLGGESLVNDATGLVGVQIGVAVLLSGAFQASEVVSRFLWVAGGGIVVGLTAGVLFWQLNRLVCETKALFVLSVLAPYLALVTAEHLHTSGVLAVVTAGFVVSWRIDVIPPAARVDLYAAWELVVYVLNALCFVFIGLETPSVLADIGVAKDEGLIPAGLAVTATVVLSRLLWIFPGAYVPLRLSPRLRAREGGYPPARSVLVVGWCGVRGVVSLAAALSLPLALEDGTPFPGRNEILFCTLCVILGTLVAQGLTLLPLIRRLGIREDEDGDADVRAAREALLAAGIRRLDAYCTETSCPIAVHHWRELMNDELATLREADDEARRLASTRLSISTDVRKEVVFAQTNELVRLRDAGTINDRTYLDLQLELDRQRVGLGGVEAVPG
ncbi:MAG: Na+/H+ antiporter [Planctomycetes bacterium]|nr:Na+/H+ antiporter [Planctomycetota bacterium]